MSHSKMNYLSTWINLIFKKTNISLLLFIPNKAYCDFIIQLNNKTNEVLDINFSKLLPKNFFMGSNPKLETIDFAKLNINNSIDISNELNFSIKSNKQINIKYTGIECSWIYILNKLEKAYGWSLTISYNNTSHTICSNKSWLLDNYFHANIDIYKFNEKFRIEFYNTGRWPSQNIFPSSIDF